MERHSGARDFPTIESALNSLDEDVPHTLRTIRAKLRSLYPISAVSEPGGGIVCGNGFKCFGDGLIQSFLAASFGGTEELFELRPGLLDGVQVGRVGRQIEQLRTAGFDPFAYPGHLVR